MPHMQKKTTPTLSGPETDHNLITDDDTNLDSDVYIDSFQAPKIDPRPNRKNPTYTAHPDAFLAQHSPEDMYEYDLRMWKLRNAKLLAEQSHSRSIKIQQRDKKRKESELISDDGFERKGRFVKERVQRDVDDFHKKTSEAPWAWYGRAESFRGRKQMTKAPRQQFEERGVCSAEEIRAVTHPTGEGLEILRAAGALVSMSRRDRKVAAETMLKVDCMDLGIEKSLQVGSGQKAASQTASADPMHAYNEAMSRKVDKRENVENNDWLDQRVVYTRLDPVAIDAFIAYIKNEVNKQRTGLGRFESESATTERAGPDEQRLRIVKTLALGAGEEPAEVQSEGRRKITIVKTRSGSKERESRRGASKTENVQCEAAQKTALSSTQPSEAAHAPTSSLVATANDRRSTACGARISPDYRGPIQKAREACAG